MSSEGNICWLASYPRSGNTWVRLLLANALLESHAPPVGINQLPFGDRAALRDVIDEYLGVESAELPPELWRRYWPEVCQYLSKESAGLSFMKTHVKSRLDPATNQAELASSTRGVVLIVRHPFDVAASLSHHFGSSLDQTISIMADQDFVLNHHKSGILESLPLKMGSWSSHLLSWLDSGLPLMVLKYEDLHQNPALALTRILKFAELPHEPEVIARAVKSSHFSLLQSQEATSGFHHGSNRPGPFFRGGRTGDGARSLSAEQRARLTRDHHEAMKRVSYV